MSALFTVNTDRKVGFSPPILVPPILSLEKGKKEAVELLVLFNNTV